LARWTSTSPSPRLSRTRLGGARDLNRRVSRGTQRRHPRMTGAGRWTLWVSSAFSRSCRHPRPRDPPRSRRTGELSPRRPPTARRLAGVAM
jgi:hypothetical protein